MSLPSSIDGVLELEHFAAASPSNKWLFIEVPHGATRKSDYDRVFSRLKSKLPEQLEHYFFVNTDIGAPEGAQWLGKTLSAKGINVVVARCLMPRTFIDPNRVVGAQKAGTMTDGLNPATATYITHADDFAYLHDVHAQYSEAVGRAYQDVCRGKDGLALQLHSYAPKSVGIEKVDDSIVRALHAAYEPDVYAKWPDRPPIDLIASTKDGSFKAAPQLVAKTLAAYKAAGIAAEENGTYHLHPVTMGMQWAQQYPSQILCVELNRGLVADPFTPFGVSPISEAKVATMVAPLASVFEASL